MGTKLNALKERVGQAIYNRRKMLGLSQEKLAEMVDIGQQSLSRMEQGKIAPKFERLQLFADALQCRVIDLFMPPEQSVRSSASMMEDILLELNEEQRAFVLDQTRRLSQFIVNSEQ
ncbi:MAG: helix-turn-helix transcriptional regulator [Pseudomonadota bacterium]